MELFQGCNDPSTRGTRRLPFFYEPLPVGLDAWMLASPRQNAWLNPSILNFFTQNGFLQNPLGRGVNRNLPKHGPLAQTYTPNRQTQCSRTPSYTPGSPSTMKLEARRLFIGGSLVFALGIPKISLQQASYLVVFLATRRCLGPRSVRLLSTAPLRTEVDAHQTVYLSTSQRQPSEDWTSMACCWDVFCSLALFGGVLSWEGSEKEGRMEVLGVLRDFGLWSFVYWLCLNRGQRSADCTDTVPHYIILCYVILTRLYYTVRLLYYAIRHFAILYYVFYNVM